MAKAALITDTYHLIYNTTVHQIEGESYQAYDEIWYVIEDGVQVVVKIKTHDGINWERTSPQ
jgi:hypothetical protein